MVRALPRITRSERAHVSALRKAIRPQKPANRKQSLPNIREPGLNWHSAEAVYREAYQPVEVIDPNTRAVSYLSEGDELSCQDQLGLFTDVGDLVWIVKVRLNDPCEGAAQEFLIENEKGDRIWMPLNKLEQYFCETGRTKEPLVTRVAEECSPENIATAQESSTDLRPSAPAIILPLERSE